LPTEEGWAAIHYRHWGEEKYMYVYRQGDNTLLIALSSMPYLRSSSRRL